MGYEKKLGKIESVRFGMGGYQDAMFGLSLSFEFSGSGVCDFFGTWGPTIDCSEHCQWTEDDRDKDHAKTMRRIADLLVEAKVDDVSKLKGKPVEAEFNGNTLKSWRLLTEVI